MNSLTGYDEVSESQAAACLLGLPAEIGSAETRWVFAHHAVATSRVGMFPVDPNTEHRLFTDVDDGSPDSDATTSVDPHPFDDTDDAEFGPWDESTAPHPTRHHSSNPLPNPEDEALDSDNNSDTASESEHPETTNVFNKDDIIEEAIVPETTTAKIFRSSHNFVSVPQVSHYRHRGIALASLSLLEYACIINVIPLTETTTSLVHPADKPFDSAAVLPREHTGAGRPTNALFAFTSNHPLSATHAQQLLSKQYIPAFAGRPPHYPGPRPQHPTDSWRRSARKFARFCLTVFKPWCVETALPHERPTWRVLCEWSTQLRHEVPRYSTPPATKSTSTTTSPIVIEFEVRTRVRIRKYH